VERDLKMLRRKKPRKEDETDRDEEEDQVGMK
jgi:hypothetical protein